MKVAVACYAGYRGEETPRWIRLGGKRIEIESILDRYHDLGVGRVVALRGDPPEGIDAPYVPHPNGFQRTEDLVAAIADRGEFWIAVSAYPEVQPQSPSVQHDIEVLGAKVAAGANAAMTQMFFDNDYYFTYLERVRDAGIEIPIIPGVFPIHSIDGVSNFAARCGATMPAWITERFAVALTDADDPEQAAFDTAVDVAADQILDLAAGGVEQVHLYTLNRSTLALAVCDAVHERLQADRSQPTNRTNNQPDAPAPSKAVTTP